MPTIHLGVELTREEERRLQLLATQAVDNTSDRWRTHVLAERGRAIEQIKRLYAVVMGFAVSASITNAVVCAHKLLTKYSLDTLAPIAILVTQVLVFVSLIALFYLGAERMLDRKYLRETRPPPTRLGLLFDLFTLGVQAISFVILANIFPAAPETTAQTVINYFSYYLAVLLILYVVDTVLLLIQKIIQRNDPTADRDLKRAYWIWIVINVVTLILVGVIYEYDPGGNPGNLALLVLAIHVIRFFVDFLWTFRFYYPSEDPARPPQAVAAA